MAETVHIKGAYAGKMDLMRYFWDAAVALDSGAKELDEGRRFPICQPTPLSELLAQAGLSEVEVRPIDIATDFRDFDDYWSPFLGGQGPAPGYAMSLSEERRAALRERIRSKLSIAKWVYPPHRPCVGRSRAQAVNKEKEAFFFSLRTGSG